MENDIYIGDGGERKRELGGRGYLCTFLAVRWSNSLKLLDEDLECFVWGSA